MITLTDAAINQIKSLAEDREHKVLRIGIRGGGCTGFAYLFEWEDSEPSEHDIVSQHDGFSVVIDPKSAIYLTGLRLDFVKTLMQHGFRFDNPNSTGSCGCGDSIKF